MKRIILMLFATLFINTSLFANDYEVIRFGADPNYAPFAYKDNTGTLTGFEVDIGIALCTYLKVRCQWVESDFDGLVPSLNAGKIDAILASMTVTDARQKVIDFSSEVFSSPTAMVLRPGIELGKGSAVGYLQGSTQEAYARQVLAAQGIKVVAYADQEQVYADLVAGRLHASLQDAQQAQSGFLSARHGAGFVLGPLIESELMPSKSAIGIAKGNQALKALLDKGLAALHADGTYARLQAQYFPGVNMYSGQ
ncbi:MAG: transporter substrate-binding domain-containing protein [Pseudomonas sp.]|uniref:transporter substrate-binding domain-containing protein n=1 Tax=Pseudomonas sp. TaxID=306 RepID=UPI00391D5B6B